VLGLGAYLWYVDRGRPSTEERARVAKRLLRELDPQRVMELHVAVRRTNDAGAATVTQFHLQRELSGWRVVAPLDFPANDIAVRRILDVARAVDQEAVISGTNYAALDREAAGLADPDVVATFVMPATAFTMRVGHDVPGLWAHYVELDGEPAAYFAPSHFKENLMLATDNSERDVRRRRVFAIRDYQVSTLGMEAPARTIELRKSDGAIWRMTQPVADAANEKLVTSLLEKLEKLELAAFVEEPTNFGQPVMTLTVVEGMTSQRLQLGPAVRGAYDDENAPPSEILARRIEYPQYFTLRRPDMEPFMQPAEHYRSRQLITWFDDETPLQLVLECDGTSLMLQYDKTQRAWSLADVGTPLVDGIKLDGFVYDWLDLSVTGFAQAAEARAALEHEWLKLSVLFEGDEEPRRATLSAPRNGLVYAERAPGVFVTLDAQAVAALAAADELRFLDEELIGLAPDDVTELSIAQGGDRWQLLHHSNRWTIVTGDAARSTPRDITTLLDDVLPLNAVTYTAKAGEQELAQFGLHEPHQVVTFTGVGGEMTTLLIGAPHDTTNRYAMCSGQPYVAVLTADTLEALDDIVQAVRAPAQDE